MNTVIGEPTRRRRWRTGCATGLVPQALLLAYLLLRLAALPHNQEELQSLQLLVLPDIIIVPVCLTVGAACLLARRTRPFGTGFLIGTAAGSVTFTVVLFALTS
jgi:hypothetical protein